MNVYQFNSHLSYRFRYHSVACRARSQLTRSKCEWTRIWTIYNVDETTHVLCTATSLAWMQVTFTACSHFYSVAHKVRVLSTLVLHILLVFSEFFLQHKRAGTFLQYKEAWRVYETAVIHYTPIFSGRYQVQCTWISFMNMQKWSAALSL